MIARRQENGSWPERRRGALDGEPPGLVRSVRAVVTDDRRGRACLAVACAVARRHGLDRVAVTTWSAPHWWHGVDPTPVCPLLPPDSPVGPDAEQTADGLVLLAWEHGLDAEVEPQRHGRPPAGDLPCEGELVLAPASWLAVAGRVLTLRRWPYRPFVLATGPLN